MIKLFLFFSALVSPVTVNVGRAGAASMNIVQDVEFVKTEAKIPHILKCLDKTPPPVLIFAERKQVLILQTITGLYVIQTNCKTSALYDAASHCHHVVN